MACLLVVDDDPLVLQTIRKVLELSGHVVFGARDGAGCEEVLKIARPDVLIIDVFMPGQSGPATVERLRRKGVELKVLLVSGGGNIPNWDVSDVAKQCRADAALSKPFEPRVLLEAVKALLPVPIMRDNA